MNTFIDVAYDSINKYGEELCGDKVEIIRNHEGVIIVMADGLGSGVKANILATLTSKIAATMLKEGATLDETVDTIVNTLPVCNIRKLAYSTFTIIKIYNDGRVYTVEYDNPPIIWARGQKLIDIDKTSSILKERAIKESNFKLEHGDVLAIVSDGAIHAGVGAALNLGWQWENVASHLLNVVHKKKSSKQISKSLIDACLSLYDERPGDDTTVVTIKIRIPQIIDVLIGPPINKNDDEWVVKKLLEGKGKKVVCGGTTGNIVSRILGEELTVNIDSLSPDIPATASISGIDLVTEGVLTLSKTVEKLKKYVNYYSEVYTVYGIQHNDGASKLVKILIEDCTHLNLWVGRAINPAHQNPDFPIDLNIKQKIIDDLVLYMKKLGKVVNVVYI